MVPLITTPAPGKGWPVLSVIAPLIDLSWPYTDTDKNKTATTKRIFFSLVASLGCSSFFS